MLSTTAPTATTTPYNNNNNNKTTTLQNHNNNPLVSTITTQFRSGNRCRRVAPVMVMKTDELTAVGLEKENKKSLADELRLGSLTEDGLSYKERFIVRCYEVGINKTATVETIANLLQVRLYFYIAGDWVCLALSGDC
ncbi:oleoyl-acyl carrier protein thioesterase, chloroplastic-like protein [Tanacetum coccineum]